MTGNTEHGSDTGTMDMTEHLKTWHGFLALVKWMVIGSVALLAFLAIFRTHG
ncbi:MAG: aa3-type cytochrome c oxidase subunit IV [Rhizomicrobium sp.]|jgi:hypothetical protein